MKMYCFRVKIKGKTCNYYSESVRLDKAIQDLCGFANTCCCYKYPLEVCTIYETYRVELGNKVCSRHYGMRRKVPPVLKLVHSSEFDLDLEGSLVLKDFISYARSCNGYE